nr:hypothetical protein [Bacilli bacterium]
MSDIPYFFKSPDEPQLKAILSFYEQDKLHEVFTASRDECREWSDEFLAARQEQEE